MSNEMIMTVSAIVTAYVTVFKAFKVLDDRFLPIVALIIAMAFVTAPSWLYGRMVDVSTIGLISSGVYHVAKGKGKGA